MSLLDALLATIAEEWEHQLDDVYLSNPNQKIDLLYGVTIHSALAKAIEAEGNKVPETFDPNTYYGEEDESYNPVKIEVSNHQDTLVKFYYGVDFND